MENKKVNIIPIGSGYSSVGECLKDILNKNFSVHADVQYEEFEEAHEVDNLIYVATPNSLESGKNMFDMAIQASKRPKSVSILFYSDDEAYGDKLDKMMEVKEQMAALGCSVFTEISEANKAFQLNEETIQDLRQDLMNGSELISNLLVSRLFKKYGNDADNSSLTVSLHLINSMIDNIRDNNGEFDGKFKKAAEFVLSDAESRYKDVKETMSTIEEGKAGIFLDIAEAKELPDDAIVISAFNEFGLSEESIPAAYERKLQGMVRHKATEQQALLSVTHVQKSNKQKQSFRER